METTKKEYKKPQIEVFMMSGKVSVLAGSVGTNPSGQDWTEDEDAVEP